MDENKQKTLSEEFEEKSNDEILFEIKKMEADYEALKLKMLKDYDKLEEIERNYAKAHGIILKRLKKE